MDKHNYRKILNKFIVVLLILAMFYDRLSWAKISQWREDQATNIWLGYTVGLDKIPIGLISSQGIPNPNGMIILGSVLSMLPDLLTVSLFLGIAQIFLLLLMCMQSLRNEKSILLIAILPLLSSVILRSSSVEFWNQYTITLLNVFFIYCAVKYLNRPTAWNFLPLVAAILLGPSLYLAGIVNAIVMSLIAILLFIYEPIRMKGALLPFIALFGIIAISITFTWFPYFKNIDIDQLFGYQKRHLGIIDTIHVFWDAIWNLPVYITFQWAGISNLSLAIKHADPHLLTSISISLLKWTSRVYLIQALYAFTIFFALVLWFITSTDRNKFVINVSALKLVFLSGAFIILSYGVSAWLNGPAWIDGERPDQVVQFLPMFLLIIFLLPVSITLNNKIGRIMIATSYLLLANFTFVNILCGFSIIRDHLQYNGNFLSEADVPLIYKEQTVTFIANDWTKHSNSKIIPVDYDLGGGNWDWVPEFGKKLTGWYPAPMTIGRAFDYEFLRRYGLRNQQEGVQLRQFGEGRYLVTYAFEQPPEVTGSVVTHYVFGRLRVSVVDKK